MNGNPSSSTYAVGSLVRARGREWVVLPESRDELLVLRPLGGTDEEVCGVYTPLESVESATFEWPDPTDVGDDRSARMLRDAVRLGFRSSAGPFRSFGRISVEPRPYQLVPLMMALKLDPVRILIADDVGVGKTIEACLIARELLDRGEVKRVCVLCPPHLAEQWAETELGPKFHIDAALVLPSTVRRLEKGLGHGESIFDRYPFTVVSLDYVRSDRHRDDFVRSAPELVIVDEAHTCALGDDRGKGRKLRHELVSKLAADAKRHMILVTATPHSGKDAEFRSLLELLDPEFATLPDDLTGEANAPHRRRLAQHLVQRRRADIRHFMKEDTPFPERVEKEATYSLSAPYRQLFERVIDLTREVVDEAGADKRRQRVRWWSMLALLRSLASSPEAAASTLRARAKTLDAETPAEVDDIGAADVFDQDPEESPDDADVVPGSDLGDAEEDARYRRRLRDLAKEAEALIGKHDRKIDAATKEIKKLLKEGFRPIVFCRFIPTAEAVAAHLRSALPNDVAVEAVTGTLPPAEREARVAELGRSERHVLVCTDCLSEGINLQEHFDAVMHYDLSWNPTRHEQREGRVDRFGQEKDEVRVLTFYGTDNGIDGAVLDVLLRKSKAIRKALGVVVAVPANLSSVSEAIFNRLILKGRQRQSLLEFEVPEKKALHAEWESAADREKRSRTLFAQETIKPDEVAAELKAAREAIGAGVDVRGFFLEAMKAHSATVVNENGVVAFTVDAQVPRALRESLGESAFRARFDPREVDGTVYLDRTHPMVESLASYVMDTALDPDTESVARRAGAIDPGDVRTRTTTLLVRFRFHIVEKRGEEETQLLAEEVRLLAFTGAPDRAEWLDDDAAEALLRARPARNASPQQIETFVRRVVEGKDALEGHLEDEARALGDRLLKAHRRVRTSAKRKGVTFEVEPKLPPDVLGAYVYLPAEAV
ncbi:MAG: helicase-related protein [Planctomycetota bacterium JB042]